MSGVSYTSAFLLGTFLECVMYGIFVSLLIAACYVQWEKHSKAQGLNRLLVFATVFFGFTVTTNLAISLSVAIRAILHSPSGVAVQLPPSLQYSVKGTAWFMILQSQATVGDIIIIYRMYHIYDRKPFICILPSITTAGLFAVGCGLAYQFQHPTSSSFPKAVGGWTKSSFCLSLFNNLFLTLAIGLRLLRVHRKTARAGIQTRDSIVLRVIKVLIESTALWTAFTVMNFFAYLTNSNIVHTFLAMTSPVVGISFCLIIVRLGHILPEARDETRNPTICAPAPRTFAHDRVAVSFPQIKIEQDVYVSELDDLPMGSLESHKGGRADSPGDLPKIFRPSLSLSVPV